MSKSKKRTKKIERSINWKKVGIIILIILGIISIVGIILSSFFFAKNIDNKTNKDFGDELQLKYNVTIDEKSSLTPEQQMEKVSNMLFTQLKNDSLNDFSIDYGISKTQPSLEYNIDAKTVGTIILNFSVNDSGLGYDSNLSFTKIDKDKPSTFDYTGALKQQTKYFYRFANSYDLPIYLASRYISNSTSKAAIDPSFDANSDIKSNFVGNTLNLNVEKKATVETEKNSINIVLPNSESTSAPEHNWSLASMQTQLVNIVDVPKKNSTGDSTNQATYWTDAKFDDAAAANAYLADNNSEFNDSPKQSYLLWLDRSDLIQKLQTAALAVFLNVKYNSNNLDKFIGTPFGYICSKWIDTLSPIEQDFGYWLANGNGTSPENIKLLNQASLNYSYHLGKDGQQLLPEEVQVENDPLIQLLNNYYQYGKQSIPGDPITQVTEYLNKNKSDPKNPKKFLYSWVLNTNELINKSFITIDYANFFNFFKSNNDTFYKGDEDGKDNYYSNHYYSNQFILDPSYLPSDVSSNTYVDLINKDEINPIFYNVNLTSIFDTNFFQLAGNNTTTGSQDSAQGQNSSSGKLEGSGGKNFAQGSTPTPITPQPDPNTNQNNSGQPEQKPGESVTTKPDEGQTNNPALEYNEKLALIKVPTENFLNYISVYSQSKYTGFTGLPTNLSLFIGILGMILIIGILVSILYRVPGLIAAITTTFAFTISCLIFSALGLSFSFGTYLMLSILVIIAYVPIIHLLDHFRRAIADGYNLINAIRIAFKKFVRLAVGIYITILIFGLVFLFFGILKIQSIGTILIISSLMQMLLSSLLYMLSFWWLSLCINKKFNTILPKKYVDALLLTNTTTFQSVTLEVNIKQSKAELAFIKAAVPSKSIYKSFWFWISIGISLLSIAGLVLFFTIGPGFSFDYTQGTIIYLTSDKALDNNQINSICNALNASLYNKTTNSSGAFIQTVLSFNKKLDISYVADQIKSLNLVNTTFNVMINNIQTSQAITKSIFDCIFISFGFITIWSLLWLNVINIIPNLIIQLFIMLVVFGIAGWSRMEYNINALISIVSIIVFASSVSFGLFTNLRMNFDFKKEYTRQVLFDYVKDQTSVLFRKYAIAFITYAVVQLWFLIFVSQVFIFNILLIFVSAIILFFCLYFVLLNLFYVGMLIRQLYSKDRYKQAINKYLKNIDTGSQGKSKDFDKVDEQEIYGLNKFKITKKDLIK